MDPTDSKTFHRNGETIDVCNHVKVDYTRLVMCDVEGFGGLCATNQLQWKICEKEMNQSITVVWVNRGKVIEMLVLKPFSVCDHIIQCGR